MKLRSKSLRTTLEAVTSLGKNRGWNHRCSQELKTLGQPEDDMEEKKNLELNGIEVAFITAGNVRRLAGGDGTTQHLQPKIYFAELEYLVFRSVQRHSASVSLR